MIEALAYSIFYGLIIFALFAGLIKLLKEDKMKNCCDCENTGLCDYDIGGDNLRTAYCDCPWGELRKEEEEAAEAEAESRREEEYMTRSKK